jgi:repressor LexA
MLELYRNIKRIREEKGMSQDELARLVGFKSRSSINKIEMGVNDITQSKLIAIANALHVSPGELMGEDREVAAPDDLSSRLPNMVSIEARTFRVPIVGRVAAGRPIVADEEIIGYEYIDNKYSKDGHEYFGLRIVGKSMEPTIMDGDIVIVRRQKYVENGEIAIVLIDGEEATAKEVKESADGITLIGHNTAVYTPHFYSAQEVKNLPVQIIGRVVQSIRKF